MLDIQTQMGKLITVIALTTLSLKIKYEEPGPNPKIGTTFFSFWPQVAKVLHSNRKSLWFVLVFKAQIYWLLNMQMQFLLCIPNLIYQTKNINIPK